MSLAEILALLMANLPWVVFWSAIIAGTSVFLLLFYTQWYKPRAGMPLPNERFVGNITIPLSRGFGIITGPVTTARMTMERYWTTLIQNEKDEKMQKVWEDNRDFVLSHQLFAIRDNNGKKRILLFDTNPEDQRFMHVWEDREGFLMHGIQDCRSVGEYGGFEYLGIKLNEKLSAFTPEEEKRFDTALNYLKHLKDAARNKEEISFLKEQYEGKERQVVLLLKDNAQLTGKLDRALSALSRKLLTRPAEEIEGIKGGFKEVVKRYFTWWQVLTGISAFLMAPQIISFISKWRGIMFTETQTSWFVALITVIGFFAIPIGRKLFGRWLK